MIDLEYLEKAAASIVIPKGFMDQAHRLGHASFSIMNHKPGMPPKPAYLNNKAWQDFNLTSNPEFTQFRESLENAMVPHGWKK